MEKIRESLRAAVKSLYSEDSPPELTRPEEQFGDFSTNIALQLAAKIGKNPPDIATAIVAKLKEDGFEAEIAGPGFINIRLSDDVLGLGLQKATDLPKPLEGQEILVEFGDPNPFKEMHIGHLYSYIVGDSISRLLEVAGADIKRLSYHGDVGLHVAKAIWGMQQSGQPSDPDGIGACYAAGAKAYDEDPRAKDEIDAINVKIYDHDSSIDELYEAGKKLSLDDFDTTLKKLGIHNDGRYLESQSADVGKKYVEQYIGKVFQKSQGAIVYEGEKVGLHTRVFLTSKGLPTYEAKDLGLAELKNRDFPDAERSIVITAHEQAEYFKVMLSALAQIDNTLAAKTTHLTHGFLSLSTGKMSSRTGNVLAAKTLLDSVQAAVAEKYPNPGANEAVYVAATKYSMLKNRLGQDIVIDIEESVSLEGNSGPYLQYAHARARSILAKSSGKDGNITDFQQGERSLARKISEYPETVAKATAELMPHHICTYLYELTQTFQRFYENNRVVGDERESQRLALVTKYAEVLKHGLGLLGIEAPDKM